MLVQLSTAELNEVETRKLCQSIKLHFIAVGRLLNESFERAYWSVCNHESFQTYVESLGFASYSHATRLMGIAKLIETKVLNESDVLEMGVSNACLLLPVVKRGVLTTDLIEIAKVAPVSDLKEAIGHKHSENDNECSILCPRCGVNINGAVWKRK